MTGAFLRVFRDNQWKNIEVEYLTKDEMTDIFSERDPLELINWMELLADTVVSCESILDDLSELEQEKEENEDGTI